MQRFLSGMLISAAILATGSARAQGSDLAAAEALFRDAKDLVAAGRVAEACPEFLASFRADPSPAPRWNLADCYEKNGQYASAWARYLEGAVLAQRAGQPEREQYARDHAKAIPASARPADLVGGAHAGVEVWRDGAPIDLDAGHGGARGRRQAHDRGARAREEAVDDDRRRARAGARPSRSTSPRCKTARAERPVRPTTAGVPPVLDAAVPPVPFWSTQRKVGLGVGVAGLGGPGRGGRRSAPSRSPAC